MQSDLKKRFLSHLSLKTILTIPYSLLIFFAIGMVSYTVYTKERTALNNVTSQLRDETAAHIQDHLVTLLNTPHQINQLNASALQIGRLNKENTEELQRYFLDQVKTYPAITSIYFGNSSGGLVGAGREVTSGIFYVTETENFQHGNFLKLHLDENGEKLTTPLSIVPNFDARLRPWYINASQHGDAVWSEIYILFTGQDMALAASRPVYDEMNNTLLGVVSVDISLLQLSDYLKNLSFSSVGQIFIIEHSGALVATSNNEIIFKDTNNDGTKERIYAQDSQSALIRQSNKLLLEKYQAYENIPDEEQPIEFDLDGKKHFLQYFSINDKRGIDWIVVIAAPESAFFKNIDVGNRTALLLVLTALVASIVASFFIASKITTRIQQLEQSTNILAAGNWDHQINMDTRVVELQGLINSFTIMKDKLHHVMTELMSEVEEHKITETKLKEQRDFSSQIINLMGQGLTVLDEQGRFEFVNPGYAKLLGYEIEDLIGKKPKEVADPEEVEKINIQRKLRTAGKTTTYEARLVRADGSIATVLITGVPRGTEGNYKGAITVVTDLSERKRMEEEVRQAKDALQHALTREAHLARTDELTGINNRRHLFELAKSKVKVAARYQLSLSVIMFDIDHFKKINDHWGHSLGDKILMEIALVVQSEIRSSDLFGRYGGEEFIIFLPMTPATQAYTLAERIRKRVANLKVHSDDGDDVSVTISIGVIQMRTGPTPESLEELLQRVDKAMYDAKESGRNCIVIDDL
ncbi:MAG: diguanylate cyclase [Anaerolineales bacterium]|nr:diguanylate cyclase [Anaerolineales bacterium]